MRAGAELGREAKASFKWPPWKERRRGRDTGLVGFLNSKPSYKKKGRESERATQTSILLPSSQVEAAL